MKPTRLLIAPAILCSAFASAQAVNLSDSDRYLDVSNNTLNEPCLIYDGVSYKAQLVLDNRGADGFYWTVLSGEGVSGLTDNCVAVGQSVLSDDPSIPFVNYNLEDIIIAEGGVDTGLRYDVQSRADASRLDLGFGFDSIRERRVGERVIVSGASSVSFSGPSKFPFDVSGQPDQWIGVEKSFSGTFGFDAERNLFTVTLDSSNSAGDYTLTVTFNEFGRPGAVGLVLVYPIEFHVI